MTDSPQDPATEASLTAVSPGNAGDSSYSPWVSEPGRVLAAKYRVVELLGRGGMGVVVAGVQLDLERPVAIKFLRPELAQNARPARRFAQEARAIAKMRSDHVVRVIDVGESEGVPFIVMERLNGHDLLAELKRGPLALKLVLDCVLEACEALAEAHALGIVHRDLKPSNLFLAEHFDGRRQLKVLDFGVSKWLGPSHEADFLQSTSEGSLIGTPAYVSPEQLTRPESVDQRTDIWALGVVLYQCLSGRLPFEGDSVPRLCAQILTATPSPLARSASLPDGLERVILRCLRKEPTERYSSVLELSRALSAFASTSAAGSIPPPRRVRQSVVVAGLATALGVLLSWVVIAQRGGEPARAAQAAEPPPGLAAPLIPSAAVASEPPAAAPTSRGIASPAPPPLALSAAPSAQHAKTPRGAASASAPTTELPAPPPADAPAPKADPLDPAQLYRR